MRYGDLSSLLLFCAYQGDLAELQGSLPGAQVVTLSDVLLGYNGAGEEQLRLPNNVLVFVYAAVIERLPYFLGSAGSTISGTIVMRRR